MPAKETTALLSLADPSSLDAGLPPLPQITPPTQAGELKHAVWSEVAAKQARLKSVSLTEAAEQLYIDHRPSLDEYVQALPRLDGQAGVTRAR